MHVPYQRVTYHVFCATHYSKIADYNVNTIKRNTMNVALATNILCLR